MFGCRLFPDAPPIPFVADCRSDLGPGCHKQFKLADALQIASLRAEIDDAGGRLEWLV